jgi:hypothetical protein
VNTLSTNHVWILRGDATLSGALQYADAPSFLHKIAALRLSDWILDGYDPLCSPRYVIWRNGRWYITPKPPATLSGANRYVIWRKPLRYLAQSIPGDSINNVA